MKLNENKLCAAIVIAAAVAILLAIAMMSAVAAAAQPNNTPVRDNTPAIGPTYIPLGYINTTMTLPPQYGNLTITYRGPAAGIEAFRIYDSLWSAARAPPNPKLAGAEAYFAVRGNTTSGYCEVSYFGDLSRVMAATTPAGGSP